jgi:hypothetical protein
MLAFHSSRRHAEQVRRVFGEEEIVPPGIIIELERPDWLHHAGEHRFGVVFGVVAGAAGTFARASLNAPSKPASGQPGTIVTVEEIGVPESGSPVDITMDQTPRTFVGNQRGAVLDARALGSGGGLIASSAFVQTSNTDVGVALNRVAEVHTGGSVPFRTPIILVNLFAVVVVATATATGIQGYFIWRERQARPEELGE